MIIFNPALGIADFTVTDATGFFQVELGSRGAPGNTAAVSMDLTGKSPGTYTGVITLTISVL